MTGALDTLPGALARRVLAAGARSHLTLRGAQINAPGQIGITRVPVMRIQLSQIAGWWVLPMDEKGHSSFAMWETDVPGVPGGEQ